MTIAVFITSAAVAYIFSRIYFHWDIYHKLSPNEWGDFFAGAFGPIAFFWLVLGYFLQASELRATVKAQEETVNQSEQQLQFEREKNSAQTKRLTRAEFVLAHPKVKLNVLYDDQGNQVEAHISEITIEIINIGQPAIDYRISIDRCTHNFDANINTIANSHNGSHLCRPRNSIAQYSITPSSHELPISIELIISYIDQDQTQRETSFEVDIPNEVDASVTKTLRDGWSKTRWTW